MSSVPTFILSGGKGSRFPEETKIKPKPMIEILKKPMLLHIIELYAKYGYSEFHVLAGYKHEIITEYFEKKYSKNNMYKNSFKLKNNINVNIINTGLNTMTGGRVLRGLEYIKYENRFNLTYGDGLADVNIHKLNLFHKRGKKIGTLTAVKPPSKFGVLQLDYNNVKKFGEKIQADGGWINGGFMVFDKEIQNYLSDDNTILEEEPLVKLATEGNLRAFKHSGFWQCVDTLREKKILETNLKNKNYLKN